MQQLFTLDSYASSIARKFGREISDASFVLDNKIIKKLEKSAINVQAFYRSFRVRDIFIWSVRYHRRDLSGLRHVLNRASNPEKTHLIRCSALKGRTECCKSAYNCG